MREESQVQREARFKGKLGSKGSNESDVLNSLERRMARYLLSRHALGEELSDGWVNAFQVHAGLLSGGHELIHPLNNRHGL